MKIKGFGKTNSIKHKIMNFMILIGVVPLVFFGIVTIFSINGAMVNETINSQNQNLWIKAEYINHVMTDIESLIANLSGIEDINSALNNKPSDSSFERLNTQAKIGYILSGYSNLNGLISIDIFNSFGTHYHVGETLDDSNTNTTLKDSLFNEAASSNDFVYWSGIENNINQNSKYKYVITASKLLTTTVSGSIEQGLLVISYDPSILEEALQKKDLLENYTLVLDSKRRIIYHPNNDYIGKTLSDSLSTKLIGNDGNFIYTIAGSQKLVNYYQTQKGNWMVVNFVSLSNIYSTSMGLSFTLLILLGIAIIFWFIFQQTLSKQIIFPIQQITGSFRSLRNGRFENIKKLSFNNNNEIVELVNLFNDFIDAHEDINTQKKLEKQLNEQNLNLQQALEKLKETQVQMFQQEKLAAIGQLAAGVAHEINNPLGFTTANLQVLQNYIFEYETMLNYIINKISSWRETGADVGIDNIIELENYIENSEINYIVCDAKDLLNDTNDGVGRIAKIVNGLKSFSRNQDNERYWYNLNEGIRTALLLITNQTKSSSNVSFIGGDIPDVYVNGGQINQVILNILLNAIDAINEKFIEEKGKIIIKTYSDQKHVYCSIYDNGIGMTEEVKKRMFEPFFTTKSFGKGTGLGMGIAYDIIYNKHGGSITVNSKNGKGTLIIFILPIIF